jgi:poly(3-hydroxybutyrate) depolymerase
MRAVAAMLCLAPLAAMAGPGDAHFGVSQDGKEVTVWCHVPPSPTPALPVVIVLTGMKRDAENYLRDWTGLADARRFVVAVPEFSQAQFPGDEGYIMGNTVDASGRPVPRGQWSFSMIEPAFDAVKAHTGNTSPGYLLYGHSAGAQFVQRFIYFVPAARLERAVAANAGWYMLPDRTIAFPYGLKGTPVDAAALRHALGVPMTVLLGTKDTNAADRVLRKTPEAEAQGPHRFARGHFFFARGQAAAAAMKAPFGWTLATAPGVGHSDPGMAPFAVTHLLEP